MIRIERINGQRLDVRPYRIPYLRGQVQLVLAARYETSVCLGAMNRLQHQATTVTIRDRQWLFSNQYRGRYTARVSLQTARAFLQTAAKPPILLQDLEVRLYSTPNAIQKMVCHDAAGGLKACRIDAQLRIPLVSSLP